MLFFKFAILASAGLVAANAVENVNRDVNLAAAPAITPAPEVRRDLLDDIVSSAEVLGDDIKDKAETLVSKGKDVYSDVKGDVSTRWDAVEGWVSTRADGVETWISTKAAAVSTALESAKAEASDAANKDNAAGQMGVGSMAGVVVGAVAAGAYLVL